MAKLTDRTELTTPADGDLYVTTDVSDTTDAATGTDKKITWANIKATLKTYFDTLYATTTNLTSYVPYIGGNADIIFDGSNERVIEAGDSGAGVPGVAMSLRGGGGGTGNTNGGDVNILGGLNSGTGIGGNVVLQPGTGGVVKIVDTDVAQTATFTVSTLTGNQSYALPNQSGTIALTSDITSGVADGDKGDITVSASGATWTIDNEAVTLAKQANMATASVVYRKTAGSGAPEVQTLATLKTDLGLTGTNSGDQTTIVGITGTKAQFDTAVTDGNIMYIGDAPTSHTHLLSEITDSTTEALGVGSLEVGHASDTTITRVSAGVIAVEGVNVVTTALTGSTTQAGISEASIASEVNTGTDAARYVSPDSLAGSNFGIRYYPIALNGSTALTTSDKYYFRIPAALTGMNLVSVSATVGTGAAGSSSSGTPTFTIKNVTDNNQMLSTSLTVDANEYTSATAATAAVINTSFDDVVTDDLIEVACTTAGTGTTYATCTLGFQLP